MTTENTQLMRDALEPVRDEILTELQDHISPAQGSALYNLLESMITTAESNQTCVVNAPDGERIFVLPLDQIEMLVARWVTSIKGVVESFAAAAKKSKPVVKGKVKGAAKGAKKAGGVGVGKSGKRAARHK